MNKNDMNVFQLIVGSAEKWPHNKAFIEGNKFTDYETLLKEIKYVQKKLSSAGVKSGHGVGVIARNGKEFVIIVFALFACGATVMPIFHNTTQLELEDLIKTTDLHAIIDTLEPSPLAQSTMQIDETLPLFDTTRILWFHRRDNPFIDFIDNAAFVRFTSGTTGKSKGVILTHQDIVERVLSANSGLMINENDSVLWVLPMAFHFVVSIILYLLAGASIVIAPDHLAGTLLSLIRDHSVTFFYGSPMHFRLLVADVSGGELRSLKRAVSTSSEIPKQIAFSFYEKYGVPVTQAYGIIEIGLPLINMDQSVSLPQSVGKPIPGHEIAILDDNLNPLPKGRTGQLAFKGSGMFSGYMNPPMRTEEVLSNGWFLSGDQAMEDDDGYVTIVGRLKSVINVTGNKVFPEEVESILNLIPQVAGSHVFGRPHPQLGEVVEAKIVLKEKSTHIEKEEIIQFTRKHLTSYKVPQFISIVESIEETLSGKIRRG